MIGHPTTLTILTAVLLIGCVQTSQNSPSDVDADANDRAYEVVVERARSVVAKVWGRADTLAMDARRFRENLAEQTMKDHPEASALDPQWWFPGKFSDLTIRAYLAKGYVDRECRVTSDTRLFCIDPASDMTIALSEPTLKPDAVLEIDFAMIRNDPRGFFAIVKFVLRRVGGNWNVEAIRMVAIT